MALFTKLVELIITQDSGYFAKVSTLLTDKGIAYRDKIQNIGHGNRRHGQLGSLGENPSCSNLYQIFVKKDDLEKCKLLIAHNKASL